jgi:hypothetical protein
MSGHLTGPVPTHRCKTCGALWRFYRAGEGGLPVDSWNLRSTESGPCCDNAPMGDQIEPLTVELLAQVAALPEVTFDRLVAVWLAEKGGPIPWNKAVELMAVLKRLPTEELDRLLALNDPTPSPAWLLRAERVVREYATKNPRWWDALNDVWQDPNGAHALLAEIEGAEVMSGALTRKEINALSSEAQVAFCLDKFGTYEEALVRLTEAKVRGASPPLDMVLHCPACGLQHIDAPSVEVGYLRERGVTCTPVPDAPHGLVWSDGVARPYPWNNPPHRSHLCAGCGHIWRPADVPTNGVEAVKTKGREDSLVLNELHALLAADRSSRRMFLARLENEGKTNRSIEIQDVIALLSDCDMLAQREVGL